MKRLLILFSCFVLVGSAQAASFDCVKASTKVEKLICDDKELSQLDEQLNKEYYSKILPHTIKKMQRAWIDERNSCIDISCLKNKYEFRIKQLTLANKIENKTPVNINSENLFDDNNHSDELPKEIRSSLSINETVESIITLKRNGKGGAKAIVFVSVDDEDVRKINFWTEINNKWAQSDYIDNKSIIWQIDTPGNVLILLRRGSDTNFSLNQSSTWSHSEFSSTLYFSFKDKFRITAWDLESKHSVLSNAA